MTMLTEVYIIQHRMIPDLYWSNDEGWGSLSMAQIFESVDWDLPLEGVWITLIPERSLEIDRDWL